MEVDILTAEQVALLFFQNVVWYLGIPTLIVQNRDPRFTSDFWQSLWKLLGLRAIEISANYPQADDQTLCKNCSICQIFCAHLLDENQAHWPDYLAVTKMAINSTINASIKKALFEVFYSENIPLLVDLLLSR